MKLADKVLIPLQPSIFDINATHDFINQLLDHRRGPSVQLAVGRHAHPRGHDLDRPAAQLPRIGARAAAWVLRDTQNYVHLAAHG
jgi:chromosome partitioning protein